jgi:dolichyl-phosphate beta-glucosyltransferase
MPAGPYLSVIVPAFNEAKRIEGTLDAIRSYLDRQGYGYEVIVAADGNDGTRELARARAGGDERVVVIGSAERGGKGRGVREGVLRARGEVIGFVDADYKTPIEEVEKLLPWLTQGFGMVIGSRKVGDSKIEVPQATYRRVGSRVFAVVRSALVGLGDIRDTQCGFKFMTAPAAKAIFARQRIDSYMFDVEILFLARKLGYPIKEVGVRWQDDGDSRSDAIRESVKHGIDLLKIRFADRTPRTDAAAGAAVAAAGEGAK